MSVISSGVLCLAAALRLGAADPTFLHRYIPNVEPRPDDLTTDGRSATYRPAFGIGDAQASQLKGIARYGELTVGSGGESALVIYPAEEQIYYVLAGSGTLLYSDQKAPLRKNDFVYLPPGVAHGIVN